MPSSRWRCFCPPKGFASVVGRPTIPAGPRVALHSLRQGTLQGARAAAWAFARYLTLNGRHDASLRERSSEARQGSRKLGAKMSSDAGRVSEQAGRGHRETRSANPSPPPPLLCACRSVGRSWSSLGCRREDQRRLAWPRGERHGPALRSRTDLKCLFGGSSSCLLPLGALKRLLETGQKLKLPCPALSVVSREG